MMTHGAEFSTVQEELPDSAEQLKGAQETVPQLTPEGQTKLAVRKSFAPEIEAKFQTYGAIKRYNNVRLHQILNEIRDAFNLPPWHKFTWFFKKESDGAVQGRRLARENRWIINELDLARYTGTGIDTKPNWLKVKIVVKDCKTGSEMGPLYVAVDADNEKIWNYTTEGFVKLLSIETTDPDTEHRRNVGLTSSRIVSFVTEMLRQGKTAADGFITMEYLTRKSHESFMEQHTVASASQVEERAPKNENVLDVADKFKLISKRVLADLPHIAETSRVHYKDIGDSLMVKSCDVIIELFS